MKKKNLFKGLLGLATITLALTSCGGSSSKKSKDEDSKEKTSEIESQSKENGSKTVDPHVPHESLIDSSNESQESSKNESQEIESSDSSSLESSSSEETGRVFTKGSTIYGVLIQYICDDADLIIYNIKNTDIYFDYSIDDPKLSESGKLTLQLYTKDGTDFKATPSKESVTLPKLSSEDYITTTEGKNTYYSLKDYSEIVSAISSLISAQNDKIIELIKESLYFVHEDNPYTATLVLEEGDIVINSDEDGDIYLYSSSFPDDLIGFTDELDGKVAKYEVGQYYSFGKDVVLYPIYSYIEDETFKVTIVYATGSGTIAADENGDVSLPDDVEGVIGYTDVEDSDEIVYDLGETITLDSDLTLFAIYNTFVPNVLTINYNDGSENIEADEDGFVTLPDNNSEILGYTDVEDSDEIVYDPGEAIFLDSDMTLFAIYDTPLLCLDLGDDVIQLIPDESGDVIISLDYEVEDLQGFTATKGSTVVDYNLNDTINVSNRVTIYAVYSETFTIKLHKDENNSYTINNSLVKNQVLKLKSDLFLDERKNIVYFVDSNDNVYDVNEEIRVLENMDIYAVWEYKEITIIYNNNSPYDFDLDTEFVTFDEEFSVPTLEFDDIYLSGWTTEIYDFYETPYVKPMFTYGLSYRVDKYQYADNELNLYPCFSEYTYSVERIEPTLDTDGKIIYTCNEDSSKSYIVPISRFDEFSLYIGDSFSITGTGTVITGKVNSGVLYPGDYISITLPDGTVYDNLEVIALQMFKKDISKAVKGDNVGILLGDQIAKTDIQVGSLVTIDGKEQQTSQIFAQMYVLTTEEGGRNAAIQVGSYRPQLYVQVSDSTVTVAEAWDLDYNPVELMLPGNSYIVRITTSNKLLTIKDQTVVIREGGKSVSTGTVISNTAESINDIKTNYKRISFYAVHPVTGANLFPITYSTSTTYTSQKTFYVDKNTAIRDIILEVNSVSISKSTSKAKETFKYTSYPVRGYFTSSTVDDSNLDEFIQFQEKKVSELSDDTLLYLIWPDECYQ